VEKQYACRVCGFVHDDSTKVRKRIDFEDKGWWGFLFLSYSFHGYITSRTCPECGNIRFIKREEDKKEGINGRRIEG